MTYRGEDDKVAVGYIHPDQVSAAFLGSMLGLAFHDSTARRRITRGGGCLGHFSSANVSMARNEVVRLFLGMGQVPDWLWFVDADMEFAPTALDDLVASAYVDGERRGDVVGGLCFGTTDGELFPTLYVAADVEGETRFSRIDTYPDDAMVAVDATGAACLLIHRTVLQAMRDAHLSAAFPWFQETELSGRPCGEDFTFCLRARALGFGVYVNTGVKVGHLKSHMLTESMYLQQLGRRAGKGDAQWLTLSTS